MDALRRSVAGAPASAAPPGSDAQASLDSAGVAKTIVRQWRGETIFLVVAGLAASLWAAHRLWRLVAMLILAMFFAYVIAPLVHGAEHPVQLRGRSRRLPRWAAISVVYLLLAGGAAAAAAVLWPTAARQIDDAVASGPAYAESLRVWEHGWSRYYERLRIPIELRRGINESALGAGDAAAVYARQLLVSALGALSEIPFLLLVPVLAFFLLKDGATIRRAALTTLPHGIQLRGHRLLEALNVTLAAYVRAQLIACVIVGALCGIGFGLIGTPYATLLGALAAVLEFVPLIGPLVLAAAATAIAAFHGPMLALWTALFLTVLRVAQDYVIYPRLIGRDIHLHPLAVILAVLAGVELGGIAGIFIAVPVVALLAVVARHVFEWRASMAVEP